MSNLGHTIRTFNRFELKYLVPIRAAEKFKQALGAHLVPDDHGDSLGRYRLSSLYYDGPDFRNIQILISDADYEQMITTYQETGLKDYFHADVIIDGVRVNNVGLRLKGNAQSLV
jgi:hypothetical protein